jgi:hypothetical protein|tara:strand:- start:329 stop:619 length:291 start_codon:yes stop_codon:yes gene_type:complete
MNNKYVKTTKHNLKDDLLIKLRNDYIYLLSKDFLDNKIIPYEYIDKNLYLDYFNKNKEKISSKDEFIITDEMRFNFINQLLIKEVKKGTAKLIVNL